MRTEQIWNERIRGKRLRELLPPRLVADIEPLPELTDPVESRYIYGGAGSGKTVRAARLIMVAEKQAYLSTRPYPGAIFISVPGLFSEIKRCFDDKTRSEHDVLDKYKQAEILVLDDFGVDKPTEWVYQTFYLIINFRYENMKTTIITSNYPLKEVQELWNDVRIISRIERMCAIEKKKHWDK